MTTTDDSSIENAGIPSGRMPKELFGVTLKYEAVEYPDWPVPRPKVKKKRQHFMFTKRSSQKNLINRLTANCVLDSQEVHAFVGRVEWTEEELPE